MSISWEGNVEVNMSMGIRWIRGWTTIYQNWINTGVTKAGECNNWEGTSLLDESIDQAELLVWRLFLLRGLNYLKKKQGIFLFNKQRIWKETIQVWGCQYKLFKVWNILNMSHTFLNFRAGIRKNHSSNMSSNLLDPNFSMIGALVIS